VTDSQSHAAPGTTLRHWLFLIGVAALAIAADQATKAYVVARLDRGESWVPFDFLESIFRITHVRNSGAAFGIFPGRGQAFLVIAAIIVLVILYFYRQLPSGTWLVRTALGLQLGGALGNVIDRLRLDFAVIDFLHVRYFPVFNVADICIVVGVGLLAIVMLADEWRQQRQTAAQQAGAVEPSRGGSEEKNAAKSS
jgi:signal peptidase II